jgi:uncharacterized OsmC-like protein
MKPIPLLEYSVVARRVDSHSSEANCKDARITLDTDLAGNAQAFNPAELLLAALAACIIKGIERVTPILNFQSQGVEVRVHGVRQNEPPKMVSIDYEIIVSTGESDHRLKLLHENVRRYGTVFNTLAPVTALGGTLRRA